MSNPKFKHFLNFKSIPEIGRIEISEPFGFDGSTLNFKQDNNRYGRDIFIFNEDVELTITREHFQISNKPQTEIDGIESNHLSNCFDYILDIIENEGWEGQIDYILFYKGKDFNTGIISIFTQKSNYNQITFKVIQDGNAQKIARRKDIYTNVFSTENLDGGFVTPVKSEKIYIKAKPIVQVSEWQGQDAETYQWSGFGLNNFIFHFFRKGLIKYDVEESYINISTIYSNAPNINLTDENRKIVSEYSTIVLAKTDLTNIKLEIKGVNINLQTSAINRMLPTLSVVYGHYYNDTTSIVGSTTVVLEGGFVTSGMNIVNQDYTVNIPFLAKNQVIRFLLTVKDNFPSADQTGSFIVNSITSLGSIKVTATSTAINSVAKAVRLIDLMRYNIESISGLNTESSIYGQNGKHYDNFALNGYLLGGDTLKPFNISFDDITKILPEQNADYQINKNDVEFLHYDEFYKNEEIGKIEQLPSKDLDISFDEKYFLKSFEFGFNRSSSERETNEDKTTDDIHTKTQFIFETNKAERVLKRDFEHIRSAYLLEEQRRKINTPDKSFQNDENLFLIDVVELPANTRNSFNAILTYRFADNRLSISNDDTFRWDTLGFEVGDNILVDNFQRQVLIITPTLLTLSGNNEPSSTGTGLIKFDYPITNTKYTIRTNEGFSEISGIFNPDNYANLRYSLKRIINEWSSYLATAGIYLRNKKIKNTQFKLNGNLASRYLGDTQTIFDKGDILINDIESKKILTPRLIKTTTTFIDFDEALSFLNKTKEKKGYINVKISDKKNIKGYIKDFDYEIKSGTLNMTLQEKYESNKIDISIDNGKAFINFIGYNTINYTINTIFVTIYDENDIKIVENIRYTNISISGVFFTNKAQFTDALTTLINSL